MTKSILYLEKEYSKQSYVTEPTLQDFLEQTEVRAYLEALAFRLACEKKIDTSSLENILRKMDSLIKEEDIDILSFSDLHYQFHKMIIDLAKNDLLSAIYSKMNFNTASQTFIMCTRKKRTGGNTISTLENRYTYKNARRKTGY